MDLHEFVAPFAEHLGSWSGSGRGYYPTIDGFEYTETLTFTGVPGKPFVKVEQKTASPVGAPMHVETGYLRFSATDHVELILAQPTGQTELLEGTYNSADGTLELTESRIVNSSTAKTVNETQRFYTFNRDQLTTAFHMAAVGEAMTQHLESTLHRTEADRGAAHA